MHGKTTITVMEVSERLAASSFRMDQEVSEELVDGLNGTVEAGRF